MKRAGRKAGSGVSQPKGGPSAPSRQAILVLGMHRSGTSAVARTLGLCGATLPRESMPPNEYNETGYWEPEAVVRLHDEFLSANASWFDDVGGLPSNWHSSQLASAYAERLGEVLEDSYGEAPLWVVKDPRLCRLFPLWRGVLDQLKVEPLAVLPARNPLEVAASLSKRDHFSRSKSLLLWLRHFLEAEVTTRDIPRSFVLYEVLLQDWRGVVGKIGRDLGLEWPQPADSAAPRIESFLDATRRHYTASSRDLAAMPDVSPWVWTAYRWVVKAARGEKVETSTLDEIRDGLAAADLLFAPLAADWQRDRTKLAETVAQLPGLVAHVSELEGKLVKADEESSALRRDVEARESRLQRTESVLTQRQADVESMRGQLEASQSELEASQSELEASQSGLEASQSELEASQSELEAGRFALQSRQAELEAARSQHESELEAARAEAQGHVREMGSRLLEAHDELQSIHTSMIWRTSKPLRWATKRTVALARRVAPLLRQRGRLRNPARLWRHLSLLKRSGLFDEAWYLQENPDVAASGMKPLIHYACFGAAEGRDPNPVFSTAWYLRRNPDVAGSRLNPLLHYSLYGADENRDPGPDFHTAWYRAQNDDASRRGMNPLAHYLRYGRLENRPPRPPEHLAESPGVSNPPTADYVEQVLSSPRAVDPDHRAFQEHVPSSFDVKAVALYLPQFHPIPENDEWWGRGFTEWTNVSRAVPQFLGHYQPRLPGELGFYDLRVPQVQRRQVELARNYGINAFCFHFYWFGGRRLLETPLNQFLADPSLEMGFCFCWANENWSRRWDGSEQQVLISQQHSAEDDLALIRELSKAFADPRYLRVGGRPVLIVYRVDLLPDAQETVERWRRHCRENGIDEILLVAAQTFGITDPRPFGFDVALEYPPHGTSRYSPITTELETLNPAFTGRVFQYEGLADQHKSRVPPPYPLIRTVCPSWDNTARRLERSTIYHESSPRAYGSWLSAACGYAAEHPIHGEKLVFINAWNEWGEGAYLEPDRRYGYAYLDSTLSALREWPHRTTASIRKRRVVLVTHNMLNHGAQENALHMVRTLNRSFGYAVDVIDCGVGHDEGQIFRCPGGELAPLFQREGRVHDFTNDHPDEQSQRALLEALRDDGAALALCNTTVTGHVAGLLKSCGFRVVSLLHELPSLIDECGLEEDQRAIAQHADTIICGSGLVQTAFLEACPQARERTLTRHQGLYKPPEALPQDDDTGSDARSRLGLPADARIVLGVGFADARKGFDLFMRVAARLAQADHRVFVIWLGCQSSALRHWSRHDAERLGFSDRLRLLPRVDDVGEYYRAADLLLLPSREDPFPSVVLEALAHGVPAVAFEGATGATELLQRGCGVCVPYAEDEAMAEAALRLLADDGARHELGETGRQLVANEFQWRDYLGFILEQLGEDQPRVSVVVPNYNYARYLPSRLESIFAQSYPLFEVIVLDDASTDDSVAVVNRLRDERAWPLTLVTNDENSGSVFQQWLKGVELARGDVLWIAEADDHANPDFLSSLLPSLDDPEVVLAYAQSRQIDEDGNEIAPNYLDYVKDIDRDKWTESWVRDARAELRDALVVKNTIPNASAVLSRRESFAKVLREDMDFIRGFRVAGDYATYVRLLARGGKIAFVDRALSSHRRHPGGVTLKSYGLSLLREIGRLQTEVQETVGAARETSAKADRYLKELYDQFGLGGGGSWRDDPELSDLSRHPLYTAPTAAESR